MGIRPGVFVVTVLPPGMVKIGASVSCVVGALVSDRLGLVDLTIVGLAGGLCAALMH